MAVNIPHYLTFPALSSLPSNSFRVRKITHWASNRDKMGLASQRRININAPPNWYLLGQHSYVEFTTTCNGKNREDFPVNASPPTAEGPPETDTTSRIRCKWGAGAPWARVRETLNAGSFCIDGVDDPELTGPILAQRGWCSRRSQFKANAKCTLTYSQDIGTGQKGIATGLYGQYEVDDGDGPGGAVDEGIYGISTLANAGYAPRGARSSIVMPVNESPIPGKVGYTYSVPLSAYSRIGTKEFIPVGLMGAFSTDSWALEFTTHNVVTSYIREPEGEAAAGDYQGPTLYEVECLRINATYLEILDPDVQAAIEKLFKKEDSLTISPGVTIPMRLELPFVSYSVSKHRIENQNALLRVNSNSPSVRGLMICSAESSNEGVFHGANVQFSHVRVNVNGHCIYECGYDEKQSLFPGVQSDLYTEYQAASHLFSLYSPDRDALQNENPINSIGWQQTQTGSSYSFICLSFENSPHFNLTEGELGSARGIDMRNVGQMEIELKYYDADLTAVDKQNIQSQNVAVVLATDTVISVDRSGSHNITAAVL